MDGDKTMLGMKVGTFLEVAMIDPEKIKSPSPNHIQIGVGLDKQLITLNSEGKKQQVSGSSFIFITDVVKVNPENNIGEKKYLQGTSPINEVLTQCESDGLDVEVFFLTKGGMVHTPTVKIGESECGNLTGSWSTYFTGSITTELNSEIVSPDFQDVVVKNDSGQQATVQVCYNAPPEVISITLPIVDGYPGNQTELKAGDIVNITVEGNRSFKKVHVIGGSGNAAQAYIHTLPEVANTVMFPITIDDNGISSVDRNVVVQIETVTESRSGEYTSSETLKCCNQFPVISVSDIIYPLDQEALDNGHKANIYSFIDHYATAQFTLVNNDLTIVNNDYDRIKEVTCNSNLYNVSTANIRIEATRAENAAYSERDIIVQIASVLPDVSIIVPANRLRSGGNDNTLPQDHLITISSTQELLEAPALSTPLGIWQGGGFISSDNKVWTRSLRIDDDMPKVFTTFHTLSTKNLANKGQSTINGSDSYTVGGFVSRDLPLAGFQTVVSMNVMVKTTGNLQAQWLNAGGTLLKSLVFQAIGTTDPSEGGYTIDGINQEDTDVILLHSAIAGWSDPTIIRIEELA
jgi:hypothetical protein